MPQVHAASPQHDVSPQQLLSELNELDPSVGEEEEGEELEEHSGGSMIWMYLCLQNLVLICHSKL